MTRRDFLKKISITKKSLFLIVILTIALYFSGLFSKVDFGSISFNYPEIARFLFKAFLAIISMILGIILLNYLFNLLPNKVKNFIAKNKKAISVASSLAIFGLIILYTYFIAHKDISVLVALLTIRLVDIFTSKNIDSTIKSTTA